MLRYFYLQKNIPQVIDICNSLDEVKHYIQNNDFVDMGKAYFQIEHKFEEIRQIGIMNNDERLANAQFVFREYYLLFCSLSEYFCLLKEKEYKLSWDKLQDCFDIAKCIGRFVDFDKRLEVPEIIALLSEYEKLYPYKVFGSAEYVIEQSHCSICGKSMQGLACQHIAGNLYWGEMACRRIDKISTIHAVALVSHPENKRCVLEISDDERTDEERFEKLHLFLELNIPFTNMFRLQSAIEIRKREGIPNAGRNDRCPCGSGKKFKSCCGNELHYKHEKNTIEVLKPLTLYYFTQQ